MTTIRQRREALGLSRRDIVTATGLAYTTVIAVDVGRLTGARGGGAGARVRAYLDACDGRGGSLCRDAVGDCVGDVCVIDLGVRRCAGGER